MLPRLDRILKDFEVFADKIARHPESLGVRGAVAPSSGLKESPFRSSYSDH
jgi:phospholipid/cholesterol/gamma-HCH transport system substrate-binding protein